MKKVVYNNLIIDLCKNERYLKYLPNQQHFVETKSYCANSFLGSDGNTVYHLQGTPYNFKEQIKTVTLQDVDEKEYKKLSSQIVLQNSDQNKMQSEINELKTMVAQQNELIQKLLDKLG